MLAFHSETNVRRARLAAAGFAFAGRATLSSDSHIIRVLSSEEFSLRAEAESISANLRELEKQAAAKRTKVAELLRLADECAKAIETLKQSHLPACESAAREGQFVEVPAGTFGNSLKAGPFGWFFTSV